jgi:hypothetical protein
LALSGAVDIGLEPPPHPASSVRERTRNSARTKEILFIFIILMIGTCMKRD